MYIAWSLCEWKPFLCLIHVGRSSLLALMPFSVDICVAFLHCIKFALYHNLSLFPSLNQKQYMNCMPKVFTPFPHPNLLLFEPQKVCMQLFLDLHEECLSVWSQCKTSCVAICGNSLTLHFFSSSFLILYTRCFFLLLLDKQ